jgi:hypothetical protein
MQRAIALFLLICYLPGCSSYRPTTLAPHQAVRGQDQIIVKVSDGSASETLHLLAPWVRNDTLGGTVSGCTPQQFLNECEWAAPLSEVLAIETRQAEGSATVGVVAVVVVLVVVGVVAAVNAINNFTLF